MPDLSRPRTITDYARLFFTGFSMGAADIVPGVSGGTMAFIMGVYETLIDAIKSFNLKAVQLALKLKFGELFNKQIPIRFLLALGFGLLTAIFALSTFLDTALDQTPTYVFAFFAGLILASIVAVGAKVVWKPSAIVAFLVGAVIAFWIVGLPTLGDQLGHAPAILFVSGMIAICAMILPGISGSFILLILGQYEFVLNAVRERDIISLAAVAAGAALGIIAFSRVLSWLLKHYENVTVAILVGFMAGSLRLIVHRAFYAIIDSPTGESITTPITLDATMLAIASALLVLGFILVTFIDHLQSRSNPIVRLFAR